MEQAPRREAVAEPLAAARRPAIRFVGPSAAMFHSAPSRSSIETNVGSPPIVSRTSPAPSRSSIALAERHRSVCHCSSRYGLVTRGVFVDPRHRHVERELGHAVVVRLCRILGPAERAGDRGGAQRIGRAGQRDVPFAGEQARGRIEADPARARHVHLGPGVQVGEVVLRPGRPIERP